MMRRTCLVLYVVAMAARAAIAQSSAGNVVTGEAKVKIIRSYTGTQSLAKPEKVVIKDFAPVGDIITDESAAAQIHRRLSLLHGSDEDSTPEILTQQVQANFSKTLMEELAKVNIQSERAFDGGAIPTATVLIVEGEFIAIDEGNKTKRVMIGFGRAPVISRHTLLSPHLLKERKLLFWNFNLSAASGKKLGAAATMGAGSVAV